MTEFPIVVLAAMECELDAVVASFAEREELSLCGRRVVAGTLGGRRIAAVLCGIGKVNAATAAQLAVGSFGAKTLVTAGVCGGLRPTMKAGEVYAVRSAVQYDFDLSEIDGVPVGKLEEFESREFPFSVPEDFASDLLATGDHFRNDDADYPLLVDDLDAGLRDMEGAAVAHAAIRSGVEVAGLKAVSNVRGAGSMVGQYERLRSLALASLADAMPKFLSALTQRKTK